MKAAVFVEPGHIVLDEKPIPDVGALDALVKVTATTICRVDLTPLVNQRYKLDDIENAYDLFSH